MRRAIVSALGLVVMLGTPLLLSGCIAPGPQNNRLVVKEWRANKADDMEFDADWSYEGEHWERFAPTHAEGEEE
jgi:hypothetical protein